jgi:hypothetical protein
MGIHDDNREIRTRRFVLEALDDTTECPIEEVAFEVDDIEELCTIVGTNVADIDRFSYEPELEQVARLKLRFKVAFEPGSLIVRLRAHSRLDDLPYKVHTNRELALMLKGSKPLAYFYGQYPPHPDIEEIPERLFDPHVAAGRFVKREYVVPMPGGKVLGTQHVLYALPNQEWRINAMILLYDTATETGWSEGFERMQGALLGYEAWQNDIFIERIYKPGRLTSTVGIRR